MYKIITLHSDLCETIKKMVPDSKAYLFLFSPAKEFIVILGGRHFRQPVGQYKKALSYGNTYI